MKVAILLQCHKNPHQINMLLDAMKNSSMTFFVHVDRKSNIAPEIQIREDVVLLPDHLRVDVQWARISQVDATLNLLKYAQEYGSFDYYWLCSGQDFPLKSSEEIVQYLTDNQGHDFIELFPSKNNGLAHGCNYDKRNELYFPNWVLGRGSLKRVFKRLYVEITGGYNRTFAWAKRKPVDNIKFYFGAQWLCLSAPTLLWILEFLERHPQYYDFFSHSNCPDESFFQTLVMNSPYAGNRMDYLHYVDWSEGKSSPKVLTMSDYSKLVNSDKLMARKFDTLIDEIILERLKKRIIEGDKNDNSAY